MSEQPSVGTVERILEAVAGIDPDATTIELWVPKSLTLRGEPISQDFAIAIILDRLLAKDFIPDGFNAGLGGRLYKYVRGLN